MKRIISFFLVFTFLLPLVPANAEVQGKTKSSCDNGECIPKIIDELEDLGEVYRKQCLPKNIKEDQIKAYYQKHGVSVACFDMINKINRLEADLQKHKANLEEKNNCENGNCKQKPGNLSS